jgi:hypothetical protein
VRPLASPWSHGRRPRARCEIVRYDGVTVEVIVEGRGPAIVLLPSLGRDSEEFDPVAALKRLSTLTPIVETHPGAAESPTFYT